MTASYLSPAELAAIWNTIRSTPCYRDAAGSHRVWADLLAAVAARNAAEAVTLGTRLLENRSSLSTEERTYLTTVVATGYARLGQMPQARELLEAQWDTLDHSGELALALRELRALAQLNDQSAMARSQPNGTSANGS